eukprot:TRINITY_DN40541_c0_g1_i1.p1 TRINITY_DN40541_c0_g1~~TRINITY_DN40541_c0_g1_i1.p1  ORF type:complete len:318 (+),score=87.34 TRINITY_DN40541_c0_g1_i1:49-954(+)
MAAVPSTPSANIRYYYRGDKEVDEECQLKSLHFHLDEQGVATITMIETKKLNSWSGNMLFEYFLVIEHAKRDPKVKALLWTGAGRAFSSGADFVDVKVRHDAEIVEGYEKNGKGKMVTPGTPMPVDLALKGLVLNMLGLEKPSVCAVNGMAIGGAANFSLLLHDFVLCDTEAKFRYPFTSLGLTPEVASSFVLPAIVGMPTAKKWIMLGDWFSGQEAKDAGLVYSVESQADLVPKALELARRLAASSETIGFQKRALHGNAWHRMVEAMDSENTVITNAAQSPAFAKAMASFSKKHGKSKL